MRLKVLFVDAHKFLPAACVFSKTIVGDPIKPRGKARFAAKAANVLIGAQEGLLRQIVREGNVRSRELTQQPAHGGLVAPDQLTEGMLIVIDKNSGDQVCISQLHSRRLR